jgi:hypothetical protein
MSADIPDPNARSADDLSWDTDPVAVLECLQDDVLELIRLVDQAYCWAMDIGPGVGMAGRKVGVWEDQWERHRQSLAAKHLTGILPADVDYWELPCDPGLWEVGSAGREIREIAGRLFLRANRARWLFHQTPAGDHLGRVAGEVVYLDRGRTKGGTRANGTSYHGLAIAVAGGLWESIQANQEAAAYAADMRTYTATTADREARQVLLNLDPHVEHECRVAVERLGRGESEASEGQEAREAQLRGDPHQPPAAASEDDDGLVLVPGGFLFRGKKHDLNGRPLAMLKVLLQSRRRSDTADGLRQAMGVDDESVSGPVQVIQDTACRLRKALRQAAKGAGVECEDPLPSKGRGADLTYTLALD